MREGEASMTARRVAAHRMSFPREPCPWATSTQGADDDQRLQADVADGLVVEATPMARYLHARTRFFDRIVVRVLAESPTGAIGQAVAVGAGYDGRSLRYGGPGIRWFELDHPETQQDKRARLDDLGIDASAIGFAPADFRHDDIPAALAAAGHDPERPSLFLCEGVAGYLGPADLGSLLSSLGRVVADGSRLVLTVPLEPESDDERDRRSRLDAAVTSMGEPLASAIPRSELGDQLGAVGWSVTYAADPAGVDLELSTRSSAFVVARHRPEAPAPG